MTTSLQLRGGHGRVALLDAKDSARLCHHRYRFDGRYAVRNVGHSKAYLHHDILGRPLPGFLADHVNQNKLDCRRSNLRFATATQNSHNKPLTAPSGLRGVRRIDPSPTNRRKRVKWLAQIRIAGKQAFLGHFDTPEAAARAYDGAARRHYGPFAQTNFPDGHDVAIAVRERQEARSA